MPSVDVDLTWYEFAGAAEVGLRRFEMSCVSRLNHANVYERSWVARLVDEVVGASGERAFCKARELYWDGSVNTFHGTADAGGLWEVRTTTRAEGRLIVRDNDAPHRWYVLVIADPPRYSIAGYIRGAAARNPEWLDDPGDRRPSWFVPQHALTALTVSEEPG